jgi:hypothetical protein
MLKISTIIIAAMIALNGYTQGFSNKNAPFPSLIKLDKFGIRKLGDAKICWYYFDLKWSAIKLERKSFVQDKGFPIKKNGYFETKGTWNLKSNGKFQVREVIKAVKTGVFDYSMSIKSKMPVKTKSLKWHWLIPVGRTSKSIKINGKTFTLPEKFKDQILLSKKNINNVSIKFDNYTVSLKGKFALFIQDDRKFGRKTFCLRFSPIISSREILELKLNLRITVKEPKHIPINLTAAMNMGFADKYAGDSQGGWTDQGPSNDLKVFKVKKLDVGGVKFKVIDPKLNRGKSCIVLADKKWRKYPESKSVNIKAPEYAKYIYLLHASAWTPKLNMPIGMMKIDYADGSSQDIVIRSGKDCNNWWNPVAGENCAVSWTRANNESCIGLYTSQFKLNNNQPIKITFSNQNKSVWMIVAACLGEQKLELNKIATPMYVVPGKKWVKLDFSRETVAGSPLDFSNMLDAPAGKYGKVIINRNGHFAFAKAPEKRKKFFGVNICFDVNFMSKKESDKLVEQLARHGYNSVRLHHFDRELPTKNANDSITFDKEKIDKMNYLFAKLKERGFYICIDLYASRKIRPGDNIPECSKAQRYELKLLVPFSKAAMNNWKQYARKLLSSKNPYTGLTWAEDPALYGLNLINEAPLMLEWNRYPKLLPLVERAYIKYLKRKGIYTKELAEKRSGTFLRFLNETQAICIKEQMRFLREDLKLKALITDLNYCSSYSLQGLRDKLDFVDNHIYQDSPKFRGKRWRAPFFHTQTSAISLLARTPRTIMPTRIFNKPFTVTEFNYSNPNIYRSEAGPVMGGYAALQDWDGIYRFAWSHFASRLRKNIPVNSFDCAADPIMQLSDYIIHFLYLRGDVQAAKQAVAFVFNDKLMYDVKRAEWSTGAFPETFNVFGLYCKIGSLPEGVKIPGVELCAPSLRECLKPLSNNLKKVSAEIVKTRRAVSSTKQIELDANANTIKIVTPKSEAFCINTGDMSGKVLTVKNVDSFSTIMASSLDKKSLADSRRIIVFHLTNITNTMIKFRTKQGKIIENWGRLPLLLKVGKADISLDFNKKTAVKIQMLNLDGRVKGTVKFRQTSNGAISFKANTAGLPGGVMIYYITRNLLKKEF